MKKRTSPTGRSSLQGKARLTPARVREIAGGMEDLRAAQIVATGATVEDLEKAVAWAAGETDVLGDARARATLTVAEIYDLLTADADPDERD